MSSMHEWMAAVSVSGTFTVCGFVVREVA